ncbi:hypothetical protein B0A50_03411 [Salinomyces thailandicus]|uniref:Uncharacterized protein n=1 Tax=Salinomyces thailandicus TaxID=706561 RepID=A0A4V5N4S6_9PEZI|nr:hypothetical protein B0A50_03411 [Salinomyces thailandica]
MPATTDCQNWDKCETWERVVAAILATGVKVDLASAAKYYGTTYNTLENRFRKIKKLSGVLKAEVENGERGEVKSKPTTPRKPKTPKKYALNSVVNSRVSKTSPSKKKVIKQEQLPSTGSSVFDEMDTDILSLPTNGIDSVGNENATMFDGSFELN